MRYVIQPYARGARINPEIYGNFSEHLGRCVYGGLFVGEDSPIPNKRGMRTDVIEALKRMRLSVLRWPGGCFADEYHWQDGIGPRASRKKMINTHWGGVVEDNSFGTHEFFELCAQIGCEPYVNANLGSGSVHEMSEWVEYMTSDGQSPMSQARAANGHDAPWRLKYLGIGNENWGCGGNMRPEYYADEYRRYQTYARNYGANRLYKIACGPGASIEQPGYEWTRVLLERAGGMMDGLSLHYYTLPRNDWGSKGSATDFDSDEYYATLAKGYFIETLLKNHSALMDMYDPAGRIGLIVDEWGAWYDVEPGTNPGFLYQQNTMRDAMLAALTLNAFNKYASRVRMANIAQLANVLQAVVLTDGERMLLTPTYHIFEMFKEHQGATLVASAIETDDFEALGIRAPYLSESASLDSSGALTATLANLSADKPSAIDMLADGFAAREVSARLLAGASTAKNTFAAPTNVTPTQFDEFTLENTPRGTVIKFTLPPCSALTLRILA